jgi:hypothetical protein
MFPIASFTVTDNSTAFITFNNIPQTFTHLQMRVFSRAQNGISSDQVGVYFNNANTGYTLHQLAGNGSTVGQYGGTATPFFVVQTTGGTSTANIFGAGIVDIPDYSSTSKVKTVKATSCNDNNGSGNSNYNSGLYESTAAITRIDCSNQTGGFFVAGSRFDLYGISTSNVTGA